MFEAQIHDVWNQLGHECQQFAEGFNNEMGANLLRVQSHPDSIVANLRGGGEVLIQLDREHKHVECHLSSQCGDFGSCVVEQPAIGLAVADDRLLWVYGATPIAADDLAVKLLTDLVQLESTPTSAASR